MKKKYKGGDHIFYETDWNGVVCEAVVTKVRHTSYRENGNRVTEYDMLFVGDDLFIEDYNVLDEDDDKVVEYKKTHADTRLFAEKFEKFMKDNGFSVEQESIKNYLNNLIH